MLERAHVVQAIGELNEDDANVVDHRQHHLSQILGLLFLTRGEVNLADLGNALDDMRDLLAKLFANVNNRDRGVLNRVMQ